MSRTTLIVKPGSSHTGVGRYALMLERGLRDRGVALTRVAPSIPDIPGAADAVFRRLRVDPRAFLSTYPVWASYPPASVSHLTSQNLASLLLFRRPPGRVVVTVHDIIPYMLRHDRELSSYRTTADQIFDRLAVRGIGRADVLIADSEFTRQSVVTQLRIDPNRIGVIHLGVDHETFRRTSVPAAIYDRYGLVPERRYLIYAGSEDPRKNLKSLVRALRQLRSTHTDLELIKVGRAHFAQERDRLTTLAEGLGVRQAIHFLDDVPEDDLPLLYNLASVCVFPSLYEGFGFPVLEAMACGTPVVCANASSLPELVGDAALTFDHGPDEVLEIVRLVDLVLSNQDTHQQLRLRGLARVSSFQWADCARRTLDAYAPGHAGADVTAWSGGLP